MMQPGEITPIETITKANIDIPTQSKDRKLDDSRDNNF